MKTTSLVIATSIVTGLIGCSNASKVRSEIEAAIPAAREAINNPVLLAEAPRVIERKGTMLSASEVTYQKSTGAWLKSKIVSLNATYPIPLTQVVAQFAARGINIATDLPLDTVTYVGTVNSTDAESALKQVLGSAGLDFQVDDSRRLVTIKPLATRTWYLNLGNRRTSYSSNGALGSGSMGASSNSPSGASTGQNQNGQQSGTTQASGGVQPSQQQSNQSTPTASATAGNAGTTITVAEDFWGAIDKELTKKLTVLVPVPRPAVGRTQAGVAPLPIGMPSAPGMPMQPPLPLNAMPAGGIQQSDSLSGSELYVPKKIGSHSFNPETGTISVQAPHWILSELDVYFRRTQDMFNTDLSFEGKLLLVTRTRSESEGLDIQQFTRWASGRYGAVVSNNSLGGVTVSFNSGLIPTVTAGQQQVGGALLGITSPRDGLQIFNAYLSEMGNVSVIQQPRVATTSGVPGVFSNITPRYYNTVTQTAAAGNTGAAAQATNNTLQVKEFGTELKILPRFDIATGLVRAAIDIRNVIPAGEQAIPQIVNVGNTAQTSIARVPLERRLNYSGEAILRDGDLIIVGGQTEETLQSDENGLPTNDGPIGGIFGTKKSTRAVGTYYFALKVSVNKR